MTATSRRIVLGFLSVRETPSGGLRGGYLLTTEFGRPIEFHYTTEFVPRRPHRVLYGDHFEPALYSEVLCKPMTDRQTTAPCLIAADRPAILHLRPLIPAPLVLILPNSVESASSRPRVETHASFPGDLASFEKTRELAAVNFDWLEPFARIALALVEIGSAPGRRAA